MKKYQKAIIINSDFSKKEILLTVAKGIAIAVGLWLAYLVLP